MRVPYSPELDVGGGDFTLEAWVKLDSFPDDDCPFIRNIVRDDTGVTLAIRATGHLVVNIQQSGIGGATESNEPLPLDEWVKVTGEREGDELRLYVNGFLNSTVNNTRNGSCENDFIIGAKIDEGDERWFPGYIDEVRISNIARYEGNYSLASIVSIDSLVKTPIVLA